MMVDRHPSPPFWPAIVAAARGCIGTRFRAQGRVSGLGLDCVGVVLVAASAAGIVPDVLPSYRIGGYLPNTDPIFLTLGAKAVSGALAGDILVITPAAGQIHFGVATPAGVVHAHAGLDRVVEGPIDPQWTLSRVWRLPGAR